LILDQGKLEGSEKLGPQVLEIARCELGDEHCHLLDSITNLSSTYQKEERTKEAEDLRVPGVNLRKRERGDGDTGNLDDARKRQKN
jgi:hypothetical protein